MSRTATSSSCKGVPASRSSAATRLATMGTRACCSMSWTRRCMCSRAAHAANDPATSAKA
ncbi:Uncharacterised protein [Bordetella pertussis]|nr:Uncharacterised protein [Bordetella pertussis]